MAGLLAAEVIAARQHPFYDIAVPDFRSSQMHVQGFERELQTKITHQRSDDGASFENALVLHILGAHRQDMVPIQYVSCFIDKDRSIRVTVQRHGEIRMLMQ